jgi:predicted esterase
MLHHLTVSRTARYATLGEPDRNTKQVWFVCHGYSQLAEEFIRYVAILDDGTRYVVAPEGLSRFYLDGGKKIGASWMTKEDRDAEIADYVAYLDRLYDEVFRSLPRESVTLHVMGFSQGAATATRWAARGKGRPDQLVLWGEALPPEFDSVDTVAPLRDMRITVVVGSRDEYVTGDAVDAHRRRLMDLGLRFDEKTFDGGHRLDKQTLLAVARENDG